MAGLQIKSLPYELPDFLNTLCESLCGSQRVVDGNSRVHVAVFLCPISLPSAGSHFLACQVKASFFQNYAFV